MSRSITHTFTCPCGKVFTSQTYEYINAAKDPQLRYSVLAGLINITTCPACGRRAAIATPFIYSDPDHELLAYVHPRADAPAEAKSLIMEHLRTVYMDIYAIQEHQRQMANEQGHGGHTISISAAEAEQLPPLQVIFGLEPLQAVLKRVLAPAEKMGRLAMSTQSRNEAERGQFLDIARKLASEMQCNIEVEDLPDEYTVWIYGSRRQIGALMRELAPRG
jgi:hypothetical protein